jgi:hypothetical protein
VFPSDLPGVNPAILNRMLLYYRLMTKWSGLGDSTELSRVGLSQYVARWGINAVGRIVILVVIMAKCWGNLVTRGRRADVVGELQFFTASNTFGSRERKI